MRDRPDVSDEQLRVCLRADYGLSAATLDFLPLGWDTHAGVWRVADEGGTLYLLKAKEGAPNEAGCLVPRYLRDQGIEAVVAPLPVLGAERWWAAMGAWTVTVYPYIEGVTGWKPPLTDAQWRAVGAALRRMHLVAPPAALAGLMRREAFAPGAYGRAVDAFEARHLHAEGGGPAEQALRASWLAHRRVIHVAVASMEALAADLRGRAAPLVVCHADLHPGNVIRDRAGAIWLIDWDDVMLAPKERDFIFLEGVPVASAARQEASAFFQGYGTVEIDWPALTYALWERLITDVIAYAEEACLRDDLGDETKAAAALRFESIFAAGDEAVTALAAAAHLPPALAGQTGEAL